MQMMNVNKGLVILSVMASLYGCATTEDVRILDEEIYKTHSQINRVQSQLSKLQTQLDQIQKEKDSVRNELPSLRADLTSETQKLRADLLLRLETVQSEIRFLSTGVEEYKEFIKKHSREMDRMKEDVEVRLRILEEKGKKFEEKNKTQEERIKWIEDRLKGLDVKVDKPVSKQIESEKSIPTKELPAEIKGISAKAGDLYKDAFETFQKGELEGARRKFEAFLKQYPNTDLSDNAQFWIGETYYLKKDFEKAILEYEKAIVKYPEGDKIPAALLKQALAFLELGDKTNAKNLLKQVIERYPHSDQAEIAKKKLEGIK